MTKMDNKFLYRKEIELINKIKDLKLAIKAVENDNLELRWTLGDLIVVKLTQ